VHFPQNTPDHILKAYGSNTIIATCAAGQAYEKEKVGYCYNDIQAAIKTAVKHTLGSWIAITGDDERAIPVRDGKAYPYVGVAREGRPYADRICELKYPDINTLFEEVRANTLLIAAAPDLLTALEAFVDYYDQAGITTDHVADDEDSQFDGDEKFNVRQARVAIARARGEKQ
jgi:hypothetical protein